jgi:hypothetical protein
MLVGLLDHLGHQEQLELQELLLPYLQPHPSSDSSYIRYVSAEHQERCLFKEQVV